MDDALNGVSRYLVILSFVIELYLIFTNVSYIILKKRYFVPLVQENDWKLKRYRDVAYISRTLYLVCITMFSSLDLDWHAWENMIHTSCSDCLDFSLIPIIYLYVSVLCRVVFSWTRSVLIKHAINLSYMWDTILLGFNLCFSFTVLTWYLVLFHWDSNDDCWPESDHYVFIICGVLWYVAYEILSFLLFYIPLKEADRYFDSSADEYGKAFLTVNQQLDKMETGQDEVEDDHRAVLQECHSDGSFTSSPRMSQNSLSLVKEFRKTVKRNLLAGVLTIIIGNFQCAVYFLYLGDILSIDLMIFREKMDFEDVFVRLIVIILGLMQYVCMMLTESNWQRAFIPFCCWQRKSETY